MSQVFAPTSTKFPESSVFPLPVTLTPNPGPLQGTVRQTNWLVDLPSKLVPYGFGRPCGRLARSIRMRRTPLPGQWAHFKYRYRNETASSALRGWENAFRRRLKIMDRIKGLRIEAFDNRHHFGQLFPLDHREDNPHRAGSALGIQSRNAVSGLLQALD